ncbi:TnsA-like heteromeric transposase endonuclease subunit [Curtobacterium sp. SAFR-003]|uniref:TnsA-like heteromeric transposase endonuclease subunit n=1 Tax=Curtobacterium sp. SAFR-003 TaxID=3387276 RepID=UPI003F7D760F
MTASLSSPPSPARSGLGRNAPVGIAPRNKKPMVWPTVPLQDLRREPWAQLRRERDRPVNHPLSGLQAAELSGVYPAREGANYKGRLPTSGAYWSSTMRDLVFYESRLERETLMAADFDPEVQEIIAQPFRLRALIDGKQRTHTPDYALLRSDGTIEIVNCKPSAHLARPEVAELHAWVGAALRQAGIRHRVATELPPARLANLSSIAHLRNPRWSAGLPVNVVAAAVAVATNPITVAELTRALRAELSMPLVKLSLRALLWNGVLETDLDVLLSSDSVVRVRNA